MARRSRKREGQQLGDVLARLGPRLGRPLAGPAAAVRLRRALGPWLGRRLVAVEVAGDEWRVTFRDEAAAGEARRHEGLLRDRLAAGGAHGVRLVVACAPAGAAEPPGSPPPEPASVGPLASAALAALTDGRLRALMERVIQGASRRR